MKYIKIICLLFFLVSCKHNEPVNAQEPTGTRIKVLSYNLRFGELATLEQLAEFIKAQDPDVVALQEVDVHTFRTAATHQNGKDFITELGFRTGMLTAYGKAISTWGGYYGIGILSKFPMASVERILLPKLDPTAEQRVVLVADVEYRDGQYFTFACTHLDNRAAETRDAQVEKINEVLTARPLPVILAGDFNSRPNTSAISEGMRLWKKVCGDGVTSPPSAKIDYIFCFPPDSWSAIGTTTHNNIDLSDHYPISAIVELKNK